MLGWINYMQLLIKEVGGAVAWIADARWHAEVNEIFPDTKSFPYPLLQSKPNIPVKH
jgi:hypothetical protein